MRAFTLIFALIIAIVALSCNTESNAIRIGYLPLSSNLPLFTAMKNNYFTASGLKPELIPFQTSNALTEALVAGNIDVEAGSSTFVTLTVAQTSADRLRVAFGVVVTSEHSISDLLVSAASPIQTVEELKGKKIGCFPGSAIKQFAELYLRRHNAMDEHTTLVELPPQIQLSALENGGVDAVFTLEPTSSIGITKKTARVLERAPIEKEIISPWIGGVYSVSRRFEAERPDLIRRFTAALDDAISYIGRFPDSAKFSMASYTPIKDPAIIKLLPIPQFIPADKLSAADFQKLADLLLAQGILKKRVDAGNLLK